MAQFNITVNQDEILQLLLAEREEAFRKLLQKTLKDILKVIYTPIWTCPQFACYKKNNISKI